MLNVVTFVKNNAANILKYGGMALSVGAMVASSMASDMQQKEEIKKAVEAFNKSAK